MGGIQSFEQVLGNINKLNRSLEAIIAVRLPPIPNTTGLNDDIG